MRKILILMTIYVFVVALVIFLAIILFSLPGCSTIKQVPATNQTVSTKFIRIVQVDKDGGKKIYETKKVTIKN